jgi:hypothetical protein
MKYIFSSLIPAYYTKLHGNIIVQGITLPIYDAEAPVGDFGSYIMLGDRNSTQTQYKGGYTSEVTLLVDIVVKGDNFGFQDSEDAANQVLGLINSDSHPDCAPDFQVVTTSVQSTNSLTGINKTDNIFRTLIRFKHQVKQLT